MKSLRGQLTLRLLLGGALLLGAAGAALDWQMRRALTAEFDATLGATLQYLATFTGHKIAGLKIEREGAELPQYGRVGSDEVFLLRTVDGNEVQRSLSLGVDVLPDHATPPGTTQFFDARLRDNRVFRCAARRFLPEMARRAREGNLAPVEVVLTVGRDRAPLDRTLAALRAALLLVGTVSLGAMVALVRWCVRGGIAPLQRLGEAVAQVDSRALATRFSTDALPAELHPIAARLNELLGRLESSFSRERRFTANIAHELRTPLAELRTLAEVNLTTPASEDERDESWRDALATTHRMEALALRLLELARVENSATVMRRELVEIAGAVNEAWNPWARRAAERGVELDLAMAPGLTVSTDRVLLGMILGNLCGNAAEHAPAGTPLHVDATLEARAIEIGLHNRAGDLTAADVPHLFERFWKKDDARVDAHHHGLGLALAAEFAALIGGALTAKYSNGDIQFVLRLPTG